MNQLSIPDNRLLIPVELCAYSLQTRTVNQFKVYLYLKIVCSGKLHEDDARFQDAWKHLFNSKKTFTKHLKALRRLNWVGYNPKSKIYFIRGYSFLRLQHALTRSLSGVDFYFHDFKNFRQFLSGAVIAHRNNWHWLKQKSGRNIRGRPKQTSHANGSIRSGVSIDFIAKMLNVSRTRACQVKHEAEKAGFIATEKQYTPTRYAASLIKFQRSSLDYNEARKLRIIGDEVVRQHHDAISSNLRFAKRRRDKAVLLSSKQ